MEYNAPTPELNEYVTSIIEAMHGIERHKAVEYLNDIIHTLTLCKSEIDPENDYKPFEHQQ